MRLGKLERAILVACLRRRPTTRCHWPAPDLWRDELPYILWEWPYTQPYEDERTRPGGRHACRYHSIPQAEYRTRQAALTRALQTLYAKGLIDAGPSVEASGHQVYSPRRAAMLGREPAQPRDEAAMNERHKTQSWRDKPWSFRSVGEKPRINRNMKSIRLTEAGEALARELTETLNSKSSTAI